MHRRVSDLARDGDLPGPSYSTVRSVVAAIDPGLRTPAHSGDAAYRDQFELVHRRSATRPNEQWQADHTLLDLQVPDAKQQPVRPWLTVVLDDYSRTVAGYTVFLGDPTAEQTALALHQAAGRTTNPAWAGASSPPGSASSRATRRPSPRARRRSWSPASTAGSPSSLTPFASTARSACAGDRPASARRCRPAATPA